MTSAFKAELATWLAMHSADLETTNRPPPVQPYEAELPLTTGGHLPQGRTVRGKTELAGLLTSWLADSKAASSHPADFAI